MRSLAFLSLLATSILAYPQHGDDSVVDNHHAPPGPQVGTKGAHSGSHGSRDMGHAGHGAPPIKTSNVGKIEELAPQLHPGNKRVRVTYGQYTLAGFDSTSAKEDEGGMANASNKKAPKPCSDCMLKYARVELSHVNGEIANFASGVYLHHLTMAVVGPNRNDMTCPGGTKRVSSNTERMLAVHNDRNETYFGLNAADKAGFYLETLDFMDLELVLKNEVTTAKDVVFTIEWEYVAGKPEDWKEVKSIWMDIAPCSAMGSDINIPSGKSKFLLQGPEWESTIDGRLLNTVGHGHDGVADVQLLINGKSVCQSKAEYSTKPDYNNGPEMIQRGANPNDKHISAYTPCNDIGKIKKGDKLQLTASYDLDTYPPLKNRKGTESYVMGVAMVFVQSQ